MSERVVINAAVRPGVELADVLRLYGEEYLAHHGTSPEQLKALSDIMCCRTAALGGHVDECTECGILRISYNSCGNRHCPKCGALKKARWLDERLSELLPVDYFHVVFTIDHGLNVLARWNAAALYGLLFKAASFSLKSMGEKHLGGEIGFIAVLHTWGQDLGLHIHLHCIVSGGALLKDGSRFKLSPKGYLFPVLDLSAHFRDTFLRFLDLLYKKGALRLDGPAQGLRDPAQWEVTLSAMREKSWEVYVKEPFGGPERVLDYMGRYVLPGSHIEPSAGLGRWRAGALSLEGQPKRRGLEDDEPRRRGLHRAVSSPCASGGARSHPLLRISCRQPKTGKAC